MSHMTLLNKDKILETAKALVAEGKLDKAIKEYEKVLTADPKDMRVKLRVAELYIKRRQIPEAIKTYRVVAQSYTQDGFFLKAVTVYKNILRLNPSLLEVNEALSGLYEKMGLTKDAIHQYEILAQAFEQKNLYTEALHIREKLTALAPANPHHRIRLAEAYQRDERKEEAIEQYEILAKQYREQKEAPKRLTELYERILPHRPENREMLTELVHLYVEGKDYRSALRWLEGRKALVSKDTHLLSLQARLYAQLNQLESSRGKYQEAAELYRERGENEKALEALCEILVILPEETEDVRVKAEEIRPGSFGVLLKKADETRGQKREEVERQEAETQEAENKKQEGEKQKSKEAEGKKQEAETQRSKDVEKPAVAAVSPVEIERWLKSAKTSFSLGKAYQSAGLKEEAGQEFGQAREALQKILKADPGHVEAGQLSKQLPK